MRKIAEFKKEHASALKNLMPDDEKLAFVENDVVNVLTNLDQDGRRILVVNCGETWDPKKVTSEQLFRIFYLIHIAALVEQNTQVRGVVVIMDFNGLGMKQVCALTPAWSKRLLTFIQDAMPIRLKQVHMVNQPYLFKMVWMLFKPFVQEKLTSRVSNLDFILIGKFVLFNLFLFFFRLFCKIVILSWQGTKIIAQTHQSNTFTVKLWW